MYEDLYKYLSRFRGKTIQQICQYFDAFDENRLNAELDAIMTMTPSDHFSGLSSFNFTVDSTLQGGRYPCAAAECRLQNLDSLAKFSAMYSEKTLIQSPVERMINENPRYIDTFELSLAIVELLGLECVVRAGYVGFTSDYLLLCRECLQEEKEQQFAAKSFLDSVWEGVLEEFFQATKTILKADSDGELYVEIEGMEQFGTEHSLMVHFNELPSVLANVYRKRNTTVLTREEIVAGGIVNLLTPMFDDIFGVLASPISINSTHLTTRMAQTRILEQVHSYSSNEQVVPDAFGKMCFDLAIAPEASLKSIVRVRQSNYESFQIFRDALEEGYRNLESDASAASEVKRDLIDPELHKLELSLRRSKDKFKTAGGVDAVLLVSSVFAGFFSPAALGVLAPLAAGHTVDTVLKRINNEEVKRNPMYFLWKVNQARR